MRPAAQIMAARIAREIARASLLDPAVDGVDRFVPLCATVRDPLGSI